MVKMRDWLLAKALSSLMKLAATLISDSLCFSALTEITIFFYPIFSIDFFPLILWSSDIIYIPTSAVLQKSAQNSSGWTMVLLMHPKCVCEQADWKKKQLKTQKKNLWALEMDSLCTYSFSYDCLWNCIGYKLSQQVSLNLLCIYKENQIAKT